MHDPSIKPSQNSLFYSPQQFKDKMIDKMTVSVYQEEENKTPIPEPSTDEVRDRITQINQNRQEDQPKTTIQQIKDLFTLEQQYQKYQKLIRFYQEYFDVTTEIVLRRFLNAFNPFSGTFFDIGGGKADLYGPFWILTTLIFTMTAAANISVYLQLPPGYQFQYQFSFVPMAAAILYLKGLLFPMIVRLILKIFESNSLTYFQILCLYGYSSAIVIPVSLSEAYPNPAIQWMLLLYAIFGTTLFIVSNINKYYFIQDQYL